MYKKILVPLDGSEFSECSLPHVKAIALGCSVPDVILLRVVEPILNPDVVATAPLAQDWMKQVEEENYAKTEDYLETLASNLKKEGISAQTVLREGKTADEVLAYASKNGIDLIVMSTHGRSGVARWFLGSVAERIARYSPVPVLLVRPPGLHPAT